MSENRDAELAAKVKQLLADQLGLDSSEIRMDQGLADLGADSLDAIETIIAIEDEFAIEINDEKSEGIKTVADLVAAVAASVPTEIQPVPILAGEDEVVVSELRQALAERGDFLILDEEHFDQAILGLAESGGVSAVVYDADAVIGQLMEHEAMDRDEAGQWFEFNIARAFSGPNSPLFMERLLPLDPMRDFDSHTIGRLCEILHTDRESLVDAVERLAGLACAAVAEIKSDADLSRRTPPAWMPAAETMVDALASGPMLDPAPTDMAIDQMASGITQWTDDLIREGLNRLLGHAKWAPEDLKGRLQCVTIQGRTLKTYCLDGAAFLEIDDPKVAPDDLGGSGGHTLRYSLDWRYLGDAVKPVGKGPGLHLDSGEFVPADQLNGRLG
jgi:acyl carrier protein